MEVGASRLLEQKNWENPHLTVVPAIAIGRAWSN